MKQNGLNEEQVKKIADLHGSNILTQIPPDPLWKKFLNGFKDPMIMILLVALIVQLVLFFSVSPSGSRLPEFLRLL